MNRFTRDQMAARVARDIPDGAPVSATKRSELFMTSTHRFQSNTPNVTPSR